MFYNLLHHLEYQVNRDSEADTQVAAGLAVDGGVNADDFTTGVNQRATGVSRIDRGIGLNKVLIGIEPHPVSAGGADNALGDGLADAEGIADGQRNITHAYLFTVGNGHWRYRVNAGGEHCQVGVCIQSENGAGQVAAVIQYYLDFFRTGHHVVIGDNETSAVNDYPGTFIGAHLELWLVGIRHIE